MPEEVQAMCLHHFAPFCTIFLWKLTGWPSWAPAGMSQNVPECPSSKKVQPEVSANVRARKRCCQLACFTTGGHGGLPHLTFGRKCQVLSCWGKRSFLDPRTSSTLCGALQQKKRMLFGQDTCQRFRPRFSRHEFPPNASTLKRVPEAFP